MSCIAGLCIGLLSKAFSVMDKERKFGIGSISFTNVTIRFGETQNIKISLSATLRHVVGLQLQLHSQHFQLQYFTDQSLYVHVSNSNVNITQWGLANEGYQFQRKLWERNDLTLQPVIPYVYLCSLCFKASILEEGRN